MLNMNDEALRRLAIAEIIKEINDVKAIEDRKQIAVNPLRRPNKTFLGRTIKSVLQHNKRQHIREKLNSSKKLHELNRSKTSFQEHQKKTRELDVSVRKKRGLSSEYKNRSKHNEKKYVEKKKRKVSSSYGSYKVAKRRKDPDFESAEPGFQSEYALQYDESDNVIAYELSAYTQMTNYYFPEVMEVYHPPVTKKASNKREQLVTTIDLTKDTKLSRSKRKRNRRKRSSRSNSHISIDSSSSIDSELSSI